MRITSTDSIALLAGALVVVAVKIEGTVWPIVCLTLAGTILVFAIAGHEELTWKQRIAVCSTVFALDLGLAVYLYRVNLARELNQAVAPLLAATFPSPVSSNCPIPRGAVGLYLGNRVSAITGFPHVIFRVSSDDVLVLDRDSSGLLITFKVFDERAEFVARLEKNAIQSRSAGVHLKRPSASNLIVLDDRDNKVLNVHFLNPQAIKITGILRYRGVEPIVINETYVGQGRTILPQACASGANAEFAIN